MLPAWINQFSEINNGNSTKEQRRTLYRYAIPTNLVKELNFSQCQSVISILVDATYKKQDKFNSVIQEL